MTACVVLALGGSARAERAPGAINPAVTQATIGETICVRGWTRTVRPPEAWTEWVKRRLADASGVSVRCCELDHIIPLELGGAPADPRNLRLERWRGACGAHVKDRLEDRLHWLVCRGVISLTQAREAIATDWVAAYREYVGPRQCRW